MMFLKIVALVYVLLGLRGFLSWTLYWRRESGFTSNQTSAGFLWLGWAVGRYEPDPESDFPDFEFYMAVSPFAVPLNEAFKICFDVARYFSRRREMVHIDDLHWSRVEDTEDVPR